MGTNGYENSWHLTCARITSGRLMAICKNAHLVYRIMIMPDGIVYTRVDDIFMQELIRAHFPAISPIP